MIFSDASRIYSTIHNRIEKLWNFDPSKRQANNLNILTGFICGIIQSKQVKLADVASDIPYAGKEESKIMQLRRWLNNETVDVELFYLPFIENLLHCLSNQTLVLAIDGSTVARGCISLVVSIIYKGRALPLLWVTRKGKKGHFPEQMHIDLIKAVQELIPKKAKVVVLGDGEFDGAQWLSVLETYDWKYSCRTAKNSKFYEEGEEFAIQNICPERGGLTEVGEVEFTEKRVLTVRAVAYWGSQYEDPLYLVSNFPTGSEAVYWYGKRFRIETLFSDFKGRGFNLDKSGLRDPERINRLLIAVSLAYIWIVFLGEHALEKEWDKIIHRTDRCDLSLFTLGKRLLKYFLKNGLPIPPFSLTLSGLALE
jgi:hypothetical protein